MATLKLMTAEDLLNMEDDGYRYDLVGGELIRMAPAGARHGELAIEIGRQLANYVKQHRLGKVYAAETGFILGRRPDIVLAPDAAFVRADRLPPLAERDGYLELAPDLVVEVISPSDRPRQATKKAIDFLDGGVRLVWLIHPRCRTVTVYGPDREAHVFTESDVLDGGDVLLGFRLAVAEIFAD